MSISTELPGISTPPLLEACSVTRHLSWLPGISTPPLLEACSVTGYLGSVTGLLL